MHVITKARIVEYQDKHPDAAGRLSAWYYDLSKKDYGTLEGLRKFHQQADLVGERVVFNIGRKYRLIARVNWNSGTVFVRWFGTHVEYDRIDAATV